MSSSPLDATNIVKASYLSTCQCRGYFQCVVLASSKIVKVCFLPLKEALVSRGPEIFRFSSHKLSVNFSSLFRRESSWVDAIRVCEKIMLLRVDFHILPAVSLPAAGYKMHLLSFTIHQIISSECLFKNTPRHRFALTRALIFLLLSVSILSFRSSRVCWQLFHLLGKVLIFLVIAMSAGVLGHLW